MAVARALALQFSKDNSTKVGCLFVDPEDFTVLTRGYNGMPRGIDETRPERQERPLKYAFFEHAERNAIFNLARQALRGSYVVTTTTPTVGCVRALLSVGATLLVLPVSSSRDEAWPVMQELLQEGGVSLLYAQAGRVLCPRQVTDERTLRKLEQNLAHAQQRQAILSKDPLGGAATFLSPGDFTILAEGYSGFPRKADDSRTERFEGEERARWVEPAIRNAVYNVVRPLLKDSVAVVTATTCVECARAISAVGAVGLVYQEPPADFAFRWGESIQVALELLTELGVTTKKLPAP